MDRARIGAPPASRRGRPRTDEADRRRAHLLETAAAIFLEQGYAGASLNGIASAARVSKATIYARYGSKRALFSATATHTVATMRSDLRSIVTTNRPPEAVMRDFALRIADEVGDPTRLALLRLAIAERAAAPELGEVLHAHIAETVQPITGYLERLQACGAIDAGHDPAMLAAHFINLANGGLRFLLTDDFADPAFRRAWADQVSRLFLGGARGG